MLPSIFFIVTSYSYCRCRFFIATYMRASTLLYHLPDSLTLAYDELFVSYVFQVERERSLKSKALLEKEEYRAHIHKLARALKRHQVPDIEFVGPL